MRTNILIDDSLMEKVLKNKKFKTKKEAVEFGLKLILQLEEQKKIRKFRGSLPWTGNLNQSRTS
ncbi:MAG: type II toxin-antitoxin system VapB family antitoxin [Oligoflexales bacterium]|nr:type II toxin-antitoxin system VapB family antitoxin [Oligoflexales bacterium]